MIRPVRADLSWWETLRHGGLLLDTRRLADLVPSSPPPLLGFQERMLRRQVTALLDDNLSAADFAAYALEEICGFGPGTGTWHRGSAVAADWSRTAVTGEVVRPRQLWQGPHGGLLPVFIDQQKRLGIGRGRRITSQVLQWLRAGRDPLALITNGRDWRLAFAGLDYDAWCEWDVEQWLEEGGTTGQVSGLRALITPALWTPPTDGAPAPLAAAILESRRGQAELSQVLGERVRQAVEILLRAHGPLLHERAGHIARPDIYRAAVRMVMRMVVVLFAEARDLLPRESAVYHGSYGLQGLREHVGRAAARHPGRMAHAYAAWPRILSLFRLIHEGSHHEALQIPRYGGELFARGDAASADGVLRALQLFETGCYEQELMSDRDVEEVLDLLTRTRVKIRQGRTSTLVSAPVDFSDLSTEYIGILYEGLLDFELRAAPDGDPIVFLSVGDEPALPLSRLEGMDEKSLAALFEKLKERGGTGSADDAEAEADDETADAVEEAEEAEIETESESESPDDEPQPAAEATDDTADARHATRTRAERWARRACEVGKLLRKPPGRLTPEKAHQYETALSAKARQLVSRVVLPGEWYLVRWGGTRKGSGTFYTRPQLAVPTVHRTLRPLAYDAPIGTGGTGGTVGTGGQPDLDAPPARWTPKKPEEILSLNVCDPACGSGSFLVASVRFLTEALYASLHHHGRIREQGGRSLIALLSGGEGPELLAEEKIPCRPDDEHFEPRLKAILKRHVVERCIYGVDLDPLAVELCRLSLWIETMDRDLPFSFLDHKVRPGNALVGCWFDRFQHYPVMAWEREGGDANHSSGVHFAKDARTKAIKEFKSKQVKPDLAAFLAGPGLFDQNRQDRAVRVHDEAMATLRELHDLPVVDHADRARIYRERFLGSPAWRSLKDAFDLWCALWFWPPDDLDVAPLPSSFTAPPPRALEVARRVAADKRFFHWELEFPDVFSRPGSGFDAIVGNPPWDIAKPSSKEFFSNIDPLYRTYGKQEAIARQKSCFSDEATERGWLDYSADFRFQSSYVKHAAFPFGDAQEGGESFAITRGRTNGSLHGSWRAGRRKANGYADPRHPYRHQGSADINLYKMFLEQGHALLHEGGRLGLVLPSGLYSDHGTRALRELLLDHCRWEWLFGFENREGIFDIHRSFKFNPVIVQKGGTTEAIRTAFMRRKLDDWANAEAFATPYARSRVTRFSPRSKAILEIQSQRDLEILEKIYANSVLLGDDGPDGWGIKYATEFHMTNDSKLLIPRARLETQGVLRPEDDVRSLPVREGLRRVGFLPVWEGKSCFFDEWIKQPSLFAALTDVCPGMTSGAFPHGVRRIARNTDKRTLVTCVVPPGAPTAYTIEVCRTPVARTALASFALLSSLVLDYTARMQTDESVPLSLLYALPAPPCASSTVTRLAQTVLGLLAPHNASAARLSRRCMLDALCASVYGLGSHDFGFVLRDCDHASKALRVGTFVDALNPAGFWRVDKDKDPELRHTVLTLAAFRDLENMIADHGGDREKGIEAFCNQNDGEGWMLPEELCLADLGLGHDERARHPQPVASRLGPRFYDWQLAQTPEESWRECHLHARNLLGDASYRQLVADIENDRCGKRTPSLAESARAGHGDQTLFSSLGSPSGC